jgi:hypothetical protein
MSRRKFNREVGVAVAAVIETGDNEDSDNIAVTIALDGSVKSGYIQGYISGLPVKATPEE